MSGFGRAGSAVLMMVVLLVAPPVLAERRAHEWRHDHFGSRYNFRTERIRHLPRAWHGLRYETRVAPPL